MKQAEDELTAAAERIREIAEAATPGPWQTPGPGDIAEWTIYDAEWSIATATAYDHNEPLGSGRGPGYIDPNANAKHIATWHPGTALLVAELLEGEAARWAPRPVDDLATYLMSPACKLARHILEKP